MRKISPVVIAIAITVIVTIALIVLCPIVTDAIIKKGRDLFLGGDQYRFSRTIGRIGQIVIGVGGVIVCFIIGEAYKLKRFIYKKSEKISEEIAALRNDKE